MTWSGNLTSIAPRSLRPRLLFSLFPISSLFPVFAQTLVLPFDQDCHQIPSCLCLVFFLIPGNSADPVNQRAYRITLSQSSPSQEPRHHIPESSFPQVYPRWERAPVWAFLGTTTPHSRFLGNGGDSRIPCMPRSSGRKRRFLIELKGAPVC